MTSEITGVLIGDKSSLAKGVSARNISHPGFPSKVVVLCIIRVSSPGNTVGLREVSWRPFILKPMNHH